MKWSDAKCERERNKQQVSASELKDHPGPGNHTPQGSTASGRSVNERSQEPEPLFVPLSSFSQFSLSHSITPHAASAISAPLHEINWPPTKDGKSQITSGEKSAIAIILTELCQESVQICHSKTWPQPACHLNCKIFINNYELIGENIWFIYVSVIQARKCDEFLVFIRISLTLV